MGIPSRKVSQWYLPTTQSYMSNKPSPEGKSFVFLGHAFVKMRLVEEGGRDIVVRCFSLAGDTARHEETARSCQMI